MSSCSFLFITAQQTDIQLVNRLLLHLRDWEYGSYDSFVLVTSKSAPLPLDAVATQAPVQELQQNEWEGASVEDVENTVLAAARETESRDGKAEGHNNLSLFLVLDDKGVEDQTIILFERAIDCSEEQIRYPERFNKFRIPWTHAYSCWCNLDISNISWYEFCDCEDGDDIKSEAAGVWWTYCDQGDTTSEAGKKRRDAVIKELEGLGQA